MKLKFKQHQYQTDATNAVVDIFSGQTKWLRKDIVGRGIEDKWTLLEKLTTHEIFSNKKLEITENDIFQNVKEIQKEQWITPSKSLDSLNFTVEMETGTGKTYVYIKTMLELNKKYGWSKFIVMVPSVAIREWINKSLEVTSDHFQEIYGKKIRFTIYNTANKSNLINIKNFANTSNIEVIIMNYQAFATTSKESRKIYQKLDILQSEKPIDIIKRARPILIIDEPQRFWEKAEATLKEFDPSFILRYSATHKKDFNKVYRLDAIDAFNQKLVKKINVKAIEVVGNSWTNSYLFLDRINISAKSYPTAHLEIEIKQKNTIKKVMRKVKEWDNLFDVSNELQQYRDWFVVKSISWLTNVVTFVNWIEVKAWQQIWEVDEKHVRRIQIRETIKSHLEKEKLMYKKWIKVLSLFFIDEVSKYRQYDEKWQQIQWEYEAVFEQEYEKAISQLWLFDDEYNSYIKSLNTSEIHKWYFSVDKKWKFINSDIKWDRKQWISNDESAYDLIMKNKEKLLSFSEPTRFIFSHSALREWWDNPNVFQICTLKHSQSTISKRQEIWRWLRICVNSEGERMDKSVLENEFFDYNTLTVIASESYEDFAKQLQKEILESISDRPTKLTVDAIKDIILKNEKWEKFIFDSESAINMIFDFKIKGYVDTDYKITDKLIHDIDTDNFELSDDLVPFHEELSKFIFKIHSTEKFNASSNEKEENISEDVLQPNDNFSKKEFQDLWSKLKIQTTYEVNFDSDELIDKSIEKIDSDLEVKKVIVNIVEWEQKNSIDESSLKSWKSITRTNNQIERTESILWAIKYDLIKELAKWTNLTRKTIVSILHWINIHKFNQFRTNPESFINKVTRIINEQKSTTLINNIIYSKIDRTYKDDIFTINNFKWSLNKKWNWISKVINTKHIYDYVKYDSDTEKRFANNLENGEISVYAKLPNGFKISTPVWNYNPDWAIVFDKKDVKYIYFIAETKWSMSSMDLKWGESLKIEYAKKHFESLAHSNVKYWVIDNYTNLLNEVLT